MFHLGESDHVENKAERDGINLLHVYLLSTILNMKKKINEFRFCHQGTYLLIRARRSDCNKKMKSNVTSVKKR